MKNNKTYCISLNIKNQKMFSSLCKKRKEFISASIQKLINKELTQNGYKLQ